MYTYVYKYFFKTLVYFIPKVKEHISESFLILNRLFMFSYLVALIFRKLRNI